MFSRFPTHPPLRAPTLLLVEKWFPPPNSKCLLPPPPPDKKEVPISPPRLPQLRVLSAGEPLESDFHSPIRSPKKKSPPFRTSSIPPPDFPFHGESETNQHSTKSPQDFPFLFSVVVLVCVPFSFVFVPVSFYTSPELFERG